MDRAKVKGSGPGTPLEDATCRQRNKTLLRAPSSIKGSDAFFGRRTAAACFAPDFPTSIRIRVLCSLGNASSPGLNKLSWRGLLCRRPPPPKFVSYGIGFVRHMFRIILREARGPIHHQFILIARYVAKSAI